MSATSDTRRRVTFVLTPALIAQVKLAAFARDETVTAFVAAVLEREVSARTAEDGALTGEEVEMLHRLAAERGFASARDMIRDFARMGAPAPEETQERMRSALGETPTAKAIAPAPKPGSGVPAGSCGARRARTSSRVANATVGSRATPSESGAPRPTPSPRPVAAEELSPEPPVVARMPSARFPDEPVYRYTPWDCPRFGLHSLCSEATRCEYCGATGRTT
jgi:hypothetical protein